MGRQPLGVGYHVSEGAAMIAMSLIDLVAYLACGVFVLAMIFCPRKWPAMRWDAFCLGMLLVGTVLMAFGVALGHVPLVGGGIAMLLAAQAAAVTKRL